MRWPRGPVPDPALLRLAGLRSRAGLAAHRALPAPHRRHRHAGVARARAPGAARADPRRRARPRGLCHRLRGQVAQRLPRPALPPQRPRVRRVRRLPRRLAGLLELAARSQRRFRAFRRALPHGCVHRRGCRVPAAAHAAEPFFLHLAYNAPHTPLQAPGGSRAPLRAARAATRAAVSTIYGMVRAMDRGVGRVLEELDRLGRRDNTLVLFTSDNGPQFGGEGEERTHRFNCNFNGAKGNVYEGGIRVPDAPALARRSRWRQGLRPHGALLRLVPDAARRHGDGRAARPGPRRPGRAACPAADGKCRCAAAGSGSGTATSRSSSRTPRCATATGSSCAPSSRKASGPTPRSSAGDGEFRSAPWGDWGPDESPLPERHLPPPPPAELYNIAEDPCESRDLAREQPGEGSVDARRSPGVVRGGRAGPAVDRRSLDRIEARCRADPGTRPQPSHWLFSPVRSAAWNASGSAGPAWRSRGRALAGSRSSASTTRRPRG